MPWGSSGVVELGEADLESDDEPLEGSSSPVGKINSHKTKCREDTAVRIE